MPSVAIVGAGPSGCYVAQGLARARPDARIVVFDALPVPYGLIRYGVAPDHQGTKAVIRQFDRLFERQGVVFAGHVALGRDVTLDALRAGFDAVVLATGLHRDRSLGIPGQDLPGVLGAGAVTRAWNGWPDAPMPVIGRRVVVIGNGNVALDLVRLLAREEHEFDGSDIAEPPGRVVEEIVLVGRSGAEAARFDPVMVRELAKLGDCAVSVPDLAGEGATVEALRALDGHAPARARKRLTFLFGLTPSAILGPERVTAVAFANGLTLAAETVLTAIGFEGERAACDAEGRIAPGLFATGWCRRGPRGTIPENRADALALADRIAAELPEGTGKPGPVPAGAVDFAGWQRIDAAERAAAPPGRVRRKITSLSALLARAKDGDT